MSVGQGIVHVPGSFKSAAHCAAGRLLPEAVLVVLILPFAPAEDPKGFILFLVTTTVSFGTLESTKFHIGIWGSL